jgi:hypothetical protein
MGCALWLNFFNQLPAWEHIAGWVGIAILFSVFFFDKLPSFNHHAFEKIKLKSKDVDKWLDNTIYFEITIPKNSQATAFQIQQKILKAFHAIYIDPVEGAHNFSSLFNFIYFFQKLWRRGKVKRSQTVFFSMQIWAQHPFISFRLRVAKSDFARVEKAIFNAYPAAEITMLDKSQALEEVSQFPEGFLAYGETTSQGPFYHRLKTFKDVSSEPVDSMVSVMEGLKKGEFMVYNVLISPSSHYFNQILHYLIEEQEQMGAVDMGRRRLTIQKRGSGSELANALNSAMIEKMKAPLFQTIISYWTIAETKNKAEDKLRSIQGSLSELNQKNMNTLKSKLLFTKQVGKLHKKGKLAGIVNQKPVFKLRRFLFWPFGKFKNYGQKISDGELYSFWHLPNTQDGTVSSINLTRFKKLPASQQIRRYPNNFFLSLGHSNFRMQEETPIGIATWDDMKKHIYILGGTGAGKSETLKTILHDLLQKKNGEQPALLIVDPKNDFATDLLTMIPENRKADVVYFNPQRQKDRPLAFPFFSKFSGQKTDDEKLEFLISIMKRFVQIDSAFSWGPELENILRQLFATAYILPQQSLSGLDLLLHQPEQIGRMVPYLPPRLQNFWSSSILKRSNNDLAKYLATTNNKLGKFLDYPEFMNIVDRQGTKISFEDMINTGKIFIANLGSSSEQMKKYYSVYLTAHIAEAIFGQARLSSENRKPTVFVVDEFQRVASDIFETLFSEVRAFNTALVISNQFMGQLDQRIQKSIESNIATKIFMRTQSVDDAEIAEKILGGKALVEDIINLPTGTAYIKTLVKGVPQDAMSINIRKTEHNTDNAKNIEDYYVTQTMEKYGTPQEDILWERTAVNSIYYSGDNEEQFNKAMSQKRTTAEVEDSGSQIQPDDAKPA